MLVGARGHWNPNSINFISERQRGQEHINLGTRRAPPRHSFGQAPYRLGRESIRRLLEAAWVQRQAWKGAQLTWWKEVGAGGVFPMFSI